MATYSYVAKDALGKVITGTSEAENEQILVRRLREKGYFVQKVASARAPAKPQAGAGKKKSGGGGFAFGRVGGKDLTVFCRQFATMIDAGVSLVRCLAVLEEQSTSSRLRQIIREVQASVESGETLSRALGRYPRVFSSPFVGLVRAGEVGGVLDETLNRLSTFLEENERLKRKVKSAMTYPVLVLFFALGVVIMLVTMVLPKFVEVFKDLGFRDDTLPAPTLMLVNLSNFVTNKWYMVVIITVAHDHGHRSVRSHPHGTPALRLDQAQGAGVRQAEPQDRDRPFLANVEHAARVGRAHPGGPGNGGRRGGQPHYLRRHPLRADRRSEKASRSATRSSAAGCSRPWWCR